MRPGRCPEAWRPFFVLAAVAGAGFLVAWAIALSGGFVVPPADHAAAMLWGAYGAAVLGFLLTAYPRQNDAPPPGPRWLGPILLSHIGTVLLLAASWAGAPTGPFATVLGAGTWLLAFVFTARIAAKSLRVRWDGTTAAVPVALAAGLAGWCLYRTGHRLGLDLGMHGFLVLLAMSLLDRLVPFFSSRVIPGYDGVRRAGFFPLLAAAIVLRLGVSVVAGDVVIAAVLVRQWTGWRPLAGLREPLVAVLHLGVAWVVAGYLLEASGQAPGSLAAHLWMLGGLGTLLLGMSMRVTLGHTGRPLAMGRAGAIVILLAQGAVLLRAALPVLADTGPVLVPSALLLAGAFVVWLATFGRLAARR